ncbi:hypothetical protein J7K19_01730, partial [bacterium]|nr:hypothetical protein [bacterium]
MPDLSIPSTNTTDIDGQLFRFYRVNVWVKPMVWIKREVAEGVTLVRILNTQSKRFENLWPIPNGTSYNFYVVEGEEGIALIDGVD